MYKIKANVILIEDYERDVLWFMTSQFSDKVMDGYNNVVKLISPYFKIESYKYLSNFYTTQINYDDYNDLFCHSVKPYGEVDKFYDGGIYDSEFNIVISTNKRFYNFNFVVHVNFEKRKNYCSRYNFKQIDKYFCCIPKNIYVYWLYHVDDKEKYVKLWLLLIGLHDIRQQIFCNILESSRMDFNGYREVFM